MKEEEITEAGGRGYMDMLGEDLLCLLPSSNYFSSSTTSTVTPTCSSYLSPHLLSFNGQQDDDAFAFQYGSVPVVPQKSSPTTDQCSSSISSMSSSPTTTISSSRPQPKKKGRGGDQKKAAVATTKKPRVTTTTTTTTSSSGTIKVRKERLGERIVALQQLVSPFGKSDTASVLHEALGYIRFLHDQVQVLSSPYLQRLPPSVHKQGSSAGGVVVEQQRPSDLRSRGLCLVPISCTEHVAAGSSSNGADLWSAAAEKNSYAPAFQHLSEH